MSEARKKTNRFRGLYSQFLLLTIIPILLMGIIVMLFSVKHFKEVMFKEIEKEMNKTAQLIELAYDKEHKGDFRIVGENNVLYKGDVDISKDYSIIDGVKNINNNEISIFYGNIRCLTTVRDEDGNREDHTEIRLRVTSQVLSSGQGQFYSKTYIGGRKYFAYYYPIEQNDEIVGMVGVARDAEQVDDIVRASVMPIILIVLLITVVAGAVALAYGSSVIVNIKCIEGFFTKVAEGNLNCRLPENITSRRDELGSMSRLAVDMQNSLRGIVENDALTGVMNRRAGEKHLAKLTKQYFDNNKIFTLAIGDIDFFKNVNDTYGHETGDVVLRIVAETIKSTIEGKGHVCRWGGEEFLMIFEKLNGSETYDLLEKARENVKNRKFDINGHIINVTMTFGICSSVNKTNYSDIVDEADKKLYYGKENGRDRVVI